MTATEVLKIVRDNRGSEGSLIISIQLDSLDELEKFLVARSSPLEEKTKEDRNSRSVDEGIEQPVSLAEGMRFLGKSRQAFYTLRRRGIIKGYRLGGRIYFYKSELQAALQEC